MRVSAACLAASAATTPPFRPSTRFLKPLDLARCYNVGIAPPELRLGIQFVKRLLVSTLRLLNLTIRCCNIRLRQHLHRIAILPIGRRAGDQ